MKLLEIVTMMDFKEYQEILVFKLFDQKTGSGLSVNEQLAEELHKPVIKIFKRRKVYARLKKIFGQQIQLKWNHCLLRIKMLETYYV